MTKRVAVIGGGPIGLAAAIGALDRGCEVTLLEKGSVGDSLRSWGSTRFFSPLRMNITPRMRELLGPSAPPDEALLRGAEMIEQVLQPLASLPLLRDRVRTRTRVLAVGRRGLTRTDFAGHPLRSERPFRLLLETEQGEEMLEADVILDATGGYVAPNGIGAGGLPARGERALERAPIRTLGQLEQRLPSLRGKRVAVLGHGHSAANAIERLAGQAREATGSKIIWIVRAMHRRPCEEVAGDPLQERQRVVGAANDLAQEPPPFLQVERRATIEAMAAIDGSLHLTLSGGREVVCDELAAFTGYGPNGSLQPELAIETSPVTLGAARLYRAISETNDCLSVPMVRPADLESGEPSYWLIGSRSYGRARTFLLNTGLQHLQVILGQIAP